MLENTYVLSSYARRSVLTDRLLPSSSGAPNMLRDGLVIVSRTRSSRLRFPRPDCIHSELGGIYTSSVDVSVKGKDEGEGHVLGVESQRETPVIERSWSESRRRSAHRQKRRIPELMMQKMPLFKNIQD